MLKEAVEEDGRNRNSLKDQLEQVRKYLASLPDQFQRDLGHVFPDVMGQLDNTMKSLQRNDCVILVAG